MMAISLPALAQNSDIATKVLDLDKQARVAALHGDGTFWEKHATDDYVGTNPRGAVRTRSDAITELKSGTLKYTSVDYDDEKVQVYGDDVVILSARTTVAGTYNGQDISGQYRVMRVWIKKGGDWRLAAFQTTPVGQ